MTNTFTPSELATIRAEDIVREMVSMSWNEEIEFIAGLLRELDAAKRVADAAVAVDIAGSARIKVGTLHGSGLAKLEAVRLLFDAQLQAMSVQADAIREYRALTEGEGKV